MKQIFILLLFLSAIAGAQSQGMTTHLTLGPGDLLSVEVFDIPELKQEIRISYTGDADFAPVGKLHLASLTVEEAQNLIASQLRARQLVVAPQVSLLVQEYATQGVAVSGEVRKPGIYKVLGPRTVLQVISEAGGLTDIASPKIRLLHSGGDEETVYASGANPDWSRTWLSPGDTVVAPRSGIVYLVGDVARSGGYVMQDAGDLSIAQLVSLGGGVLHTAKSSKAKLVRRAGAQRTQIEVDVKAILRGAAPDLQLQADDILFIPNSAWKDAANRLQNITQMTAGAAIYTSLN